VQQKALAAIGTMNFSARSTTEQKACWSHPIEPASTPGKVHGDFPTPAAGTCG
jgi:hypothetical protein